MARKKQSISDRIIEDFLSLPPAEGKLLLSFLTTTTRLANAAPGRQRAALLQVDQLKVVNNEVVPAVAPVPRKVRQPRIPRAPVAAEVPAGDPGPVMEVGDPGDEA